MREVKAEIGIQESKENEEETGGIINQPKERKVRTKVRKERTKVNLESHGKKQKVLLIPLSL